MAGLWTSESWSASPTLSVILPRGAARGATAEVVFHGANLGDAVDLLFHEPGLSLAKMEVVDSNQVKCVLGIAPDTPLGPQPVRIRTRTGISNLALFSVGNLRELAEPEPNDDPKNAPEVPLDSTVNGRVTSEDVDFYAVQLKPGDRLAVEIEALRLGTVLFDPKLRLFGPAGHELIAEDDTSLCAQDAAFVHVAEATGRYTVAVSEAAYGGAENDYYRLHLGRFPRPLAMSPLGGVSAATTTVTWLGDPGISTETLSVPETSIPRTVRVSSKSQAGESPTRLRFRSSPYPGILESEPNNQADQATPGSIPGAFDGILSQAGDEDFFQFPGIPGQSFEVRVWARELGSPLDSVLAVFGPDGGALLSDDDSAGIDSVGRITTSSTATHRIEVRDHLGRGGPLFSYRVEVNPIRPTVNLTLLENKPVQAAVPRGNRALLLLSAQRNDFGGALNLGFGRLPDAVRAEHQPFREDLSTLPVLISAATEAQIAGALVDITAAHSADPSITGRLSQDVVLVYGDNEVVFLPQRVDRVALAVTDPAPFEIEMHQPKVPIVRGGAMDLVVRARRAPGFADAIDLRVPWTPSGVGAGTGIIPAGATETSVHLDAGSGAALGTWKLAVTGSSAGWTVATPFIDLEVSEPWVTFEVVKAETERGKPVEMTVSLTQAHPFAGTFKAELLGYPGGISVPPLDFTRETTALQFPITVTPEAPSGKHEGLFVRAILEASGETILHQSGGGQLVVYDPLPPELQQQQPTPAPAVEAQAEQPKRKTRFPNG
ncbi:MAG: hypothetical protein GHCLOJNM_04519 [bacterium]|nr:hypothetical protein [bacterium]